MTGTRRSSDTKAAILVAARTRFAAEGYRSTTVRAVARDAGIDPALVMRYFGGKADLFVAATDIDLRIPDLSDVPVAEHGERLVPVGQAHLERAAHPAPHRLRRNPGHAGDR